MRLSRNNKGTSLVELVIAMAIAAIVLGIIMMFINGVSKSFRRTNDEVNLQMEAQTTINQISNIAMEAKDMEKYPATGEADPVTGELRYTFEGNNNEFITFVFASHESKLYQVQTTDFLTAQTAAYNMQNNFLAEYVTELKIDENTAKQSVTINLKLALGNDNYQIKKTVKMRNAR